MSWTTLNMTGKTKLDDAIQNSPLIRVVYEAIEWDSKATEDFQRTENSLRLLFENVGLSGSPSPLLRRLMNKAELALQIL